MPSHIEKHVASLELSMDLKELGVKQESLFGWCRAFSRKSGDLEQDGKWYAHTVKRVSDGEFSAFLASELGEMLPFAVPQPEGADVIGPGEDVFLTFRKRKNANGVLWYVSYDCPSGFSEMEEMCADTEADARAKMLIHLIKQGIVKV